jgi:hypothetical protein
MTTLALVAWLISCFFLMMGLGSLASLVRDYLRIRAAAHWPTTDGVVTATHMAELQARRGLDEYRPVVLYRYKVGEIEYEGTRLAFGDEVFHSRSPSEKVLRSYPVGSAIRVRYAPERPGNSVLRAEWTQQHWHDLGVTMLFLGLPGLTIFGLVVNLLIAR